MSKAFVYSSAPHTAQGNAGKTKPAAYDGGLEEGTNLMHNPRVVRGNTYSSKVVTQNAQLEAERIRAETERRMKEDLARSRRAAPPAPRTPPAVAGRVHADVQTENYLEELTDRPVEVDMGTQTQSFLDRPPSPLFVPAKTGVDVDTQIEPGDLFDFDLEVKPILEVLVGKTLEVAFLELMGEEELEAIHKQVEEFEHMRNAELAEVQRLEAEAKRKFAEKQRRLEQAREHKKAQAELQEKVAAQNFVKNCLSDLYVNVFDSLEDAGHFYDPVRKEVTDIFIPWLFQSTTDQVDKVVAAHTMIDELLKSAMERSAAASE